MQNQGKMNNIIWVQDEWIVLSVVPVCIVFVMNCFEALTDPMQNVQDTTLRHRAPLIPQLLQNGPQTSLLQRNDSASETRHIFLEVWKGKRNTAHLHWCTGATARPRTFRRAPWRCVRSGWGCWGGWRGGASPPRSEPPYGPRGHGKGCALEHRSVRRVRPRPGQHSWNL